MTSSIVAEENPDWRKIASGTEESQNCFPPQARRCGNARPRVEFSLSSAIHPEMFTSEHSALTN
ncbi:hypothetical protein GGI64_006066 [Rhizobium leguminosarum]|uniref:Uncharacterized protein n=1 Tax=Rhizobium leguminosarum TaxID=384 RepID=A0A7W9ZQ99_RHILE|nr:MULTISPECIES: hypothetical protein [Rhizobium]MBB6220878.1 hypothetical protein [Rhizobium leguminosarum]NYJ14961.1 hypothetical protein [Rhizobium leguminosarum]